MSTLIKTEDGWKKVAGTTDELVVGASTVRRGTITTGAIEPQHNELAVITFDSPMPDTSYEVIISIDASGNRAITGNVSDKTVNGFNLYIQNDAIGTTTTPVCHYTAFKLVEQGKTDLTVGEFVTGNLSNGGIFTAPSFGFVNVHLVSASGSKIVSINDTTVWSGTVEQFGQEFSSIVAKGDVVKLTGTTGRYTFRPIY